MHESGRLRPGPPPVAALPTGAACGPGSARTARATCASRARSERQRGSGRRLQVAAAARVRGLWRRTFWSNRRGWRPGRSSDAGFGPGPDMRRAVHPQAGHTPGHNAAKHTKAAILRNTSEATARERAAQSPQSCCGGLGRASRRRARVDRKLRPDYHHSLRAVENTHRGKQGSASLVRCPKDALPRGRPIVRLRSQGERACVGPERCAPSVSEGASFADLAIFRSKVSLGCCFTSMTSRPCGIKRQAGERQKCRARARWAGAWSLLPGGIVERPRREGRPGGPLEVMYWWAYFTLAKLAGGWSPM